MSFSFTSLPYGWKIAAGITLAGATIYVASNTRHRVNQVDVIELALGVTERCLATLYATNPVTYYVAPPSFVRSWYSNSYETTNVPGDTVTNWTAVLHTNVFTNAIGWRTDRAMMVELDAKIKELVPYYVDINTVYDGTTNIAMLTVTGLFATLQIGDHTNQFTQIPCWTNNAGQTNCTTNAATFGPWAWRNYVVAWQERYKVLNALKKVKLPPTIVGQKKIVGGSWYGYGTWYDDWVNHVTTNWSSGVWVTNSYSIYSVEFSRGQMGVLLGVVVTREKGEIFIPVALDGSFALYLYASGYFSSAYYGPNWSTNDMESTGKIGLFLYSTDTGVAGDTIAKSIMDSDVNPIIYAPNYPATEEGGVYGNANWHNQHSFFGYSDAFWISTPTFNYCVTKFW